MKVFNPEIFQNPVLQNNLRAYLARHPNDFERFVQIIDRPKVEIKDLTNLTVAPPSPNYRPRLCFIGSIFNPTFWQKTKELWKSDAYFIVEGNPDVISHQFQTVDMVPWIMDDRVHMILGYETHEDLIAPMQLIMRQTRYAGKLLLTQTLTPTKEDGIEDKWVDYAINLNQVIQKTVDHVFFNFGHIDDSIEGLKATFANISRIREASGIEELKDLHKGKQIVVVGAGPSLDKDIELLAKNCDRFIIVAVDAAVKPLLKYGCRVDYVTTIERFSGFQEAFFQGLPPMAAELVCYPVVHPFTISHYPGPVRFVYRNYAWFAAFEKGWPMGILESGGSASHLAMKLAFHLGAEHVILVGCDMTYEKHPEKEEWRSHCQDTAYAAEWDRYKTYDEIVGSNDFYGWYDVEANDGSTVKTHVIYHQWAKEYSSIILAMGVEDRVITTATGGVKTPRLPYVSLAELLEVAPVIDTTKTYPTRKYQSSGIDLKKLVKVFKGYDTVINDVVSILSDALKIPTTVNEEIVELSANILYQKLAFDTFFTAFYIQNCAMEFFKAEAKWYALEASEENYEQRLWALIGIYQVLQNLSGKTLKVLEDSIHE